MKSTDGADAHDEHLSDAAFERLRATDPAAGLAPDLVALRAAVDVDATADAPRRRRDARWFQLAAVSAGVLAVGLGGFVLGERAAEPAPLAEEQPESAVGLEPALGGDAADSRAVGPDAASSASSAEKMIAPAWSGRTTFSSVGLDDVPARARAWAFDPSAVFSDATVARLAAALAVQGPPELSYGSWRVGPADWTGPVVELSSDSQSSFFFSDPTLDPWTEEGATRDAPSAATATDLLTGVMATLGVDSAAFEIESPDEMQSPGARSVTAHQLVDGTRSGVRWELTATTDGIFSLSGQLAPLVDLGEYDVVGAQTGVGRLQDPRFGAVGGDMIAYSRVEDGVQPALPEAVPGLDATLVPEELGAGADASSTDVAPSDPADPAAVPVLPSTPQPGAVFPWPVSHVTITGATLTTSTFYQPDGGTVILPAWTFSDANGSQWTTVALADAHLDLAAAG